MLGLRKKKGGNRLSAQHELAMAGASPETNM